MTHAGRELVPPDIRQFEVRQRRRWERHLDAAEECVVFHQQARELLKSWIMADHQDVPDVVADRAQDRAQDSAGRLVDFGDEARPKRLPIARSDMDKRFSTLEFMLKTQDTERKQAETDNRIAVSQAEIILAAAAQAQARPEGGGRGGVDESE